MFSKMPLLAAVAAALALTAAPSFAQDADADLARAQGGPEFVPDEVLVKFRPATAAADKLAARGRANAVGAEVITTPLMRQLGEGDIELVRLQDGMTVANAMARLRGHFAVEYAEPNWIYRHDAESNDTYYTNGSLWGMYGSGTSPSNQYGSGAATAWANDKTGSSAVYVGIIDEGYMYTHEDLQSVNGEQPSARCNCGSEDPRTDVDPSAQTLPGDPNDRRFRSAPIRSVQSGRRDSWSQGASVRWMWRLPMNHQPVAANWRSPLILAALARVPLRGAGSWPVSRSAWNKELSMNRRPVAADVRRRKALSHLTWPPLHVRGNPPLLTSGATSPPPICPDPIGVTAYGSWSQGVIR